MKKGNVSALSFLLAVIIGITCCVVPAYAEDASLVIPESKMLAVARGTPDRTPPTLINVETTEEVEASNNITVTVTATDDISGIEEITLHFVNRVTGKELFVILHEQHRVKNEDVYSREEEINKFEPTGEFYLESATLKDDSGNKSVYFSKDYPYLEDGNSLLPQEIVFEIVNTDTNLSDYNAPQLELVSLDKVEVEAPGTVKITVKATDDISGVEEIGLAFKSANNKHSYFLRLDKLNKTETDTYSDVIEVNQFEPSGEFYLETVDLIDNSNNKSIYFSKYYPYLWQNELLLPQEISFIVMNEDDDSILITNTQSSDLVKNIREQGDNAKILINYKTESNLSEDIFDAIKGTDKTIVLESDGIQWEFNGRDIETSKPIDLNVNIAKIDSSLTGNAQSIQNIVKDVPTMVLSFANNGKLPGKAKIRVKVDYAFRKYIGEENLYVYYYDNATGELVSVAQDIDISQEGYLSFEIDHNSDFIITNEAIQTGGSNPTPNNPIYRPSNSGGSSGGSGGGSSGSSTYKSTPMLAIKNRAPTLTTQMTNAIKKAISTATVNGQQQAVATIAITDLELSGITLQALQRTIQTTFKDQKVTVTPKMIFSKSNGGQKEYSISFNPLTVQTTEIVRLELTQKEPSLQSLFEKYFTNHLSTITFKQSNPLGFPVEVAVKMDFSGFDTKNLRIYHYDRAKNVYSLLADTKYYVDKDSFLHFTTILGGDIIIGDGLLSRK